MNPDNGTDLDVVEVQERPLPSAPNAQLFAGSATERIRAAAEVANELRKVVRSQKLSQRIADREHVLIEGWQTLGTLVGVFAVKDSGVVQLPWPELIELPDEPPKPGPEPKRSSADRPAWEAADMARRAWEQHRDLIGARNRGLAYGFSASWRALKDGSPVGWGEGRCTRGERTWATRDDYAIAGMAQTRGQSRALAAPLRFIVKLAGYASTPAEDLDGAPSSPYGPEGDNAADAKAAADVQMTHPGIDGPTFVRFVCEQFGTEHLPLASARMAAAIRWATSSPRMTGNEAQEAAQETTDAPAPEREADDGN